MALSAPGRITLSMNRVAASCWNRKRSRMLLLVSIRIARRSGRLVSAVNSRMRWGFLFSLISKSSLVRSVTKRPFLSETVNNKFTRFTSSVIRLAGSEAAGFCSCSRVGNTSKARNSAGTAANFMSVRFNSIYFHCSSGLDQPLHQLRRERSGHRDAALRSRRCEGDLVSMQEVSSIFPCGGAVQFIARDRMADARQMNTNLVRTASADLHLDVGKLREPVEHAILGNGRAARCQASSHTSPVNGIA